jgi:hypothetical protein
MSMMNAYCVDIIVINKHGGNDSWGDPTSGETVYIKGYVEWKTRLVRNQKGEEVTSTVMVYLPKRGVWNALGRRLSYEDRISIDAGGVDVYGDVPDNSLDRAIISIQQPKDFSHPHYEVYLA